MILPPHNRGDLSAAQWKRIAPLLPPQKPTVGRPNNDHFSIINGILWVLRTGAPWRDIPEERYGPWAYYLRTLLPSRVNRESGARLLQRLQQQADQSGKINWELPDRRWQRRACSPTCCRGNSGRARPKQ